LRKKKGKKEKDGENNQFLLPSRKKEGLGYLLSFVKRKKREKRKAEEGHRQYTFLLPSLEKKGRGRKRK